MATSARDALVFVQDELDTATLYEALALREPDPRLAGIYRRLAETERKHAEHWIAQLRAQGVTIPQHRLGWRVRVLRAFARRLGARSIAAIVADQEIADAKKYAGVPDRAPGMDADERGHARALRAIVGRSGGEGPFIAELEGRHRATAGNALRAAVLGANDGLLSNLSLVMGVAGASLAAREILITGFAGLLAGASSMALGEWLSVTSSRELYERQIAVERGEIATNPEEETEELSLIYQSKGVPESQARQIAERLMKDEAAALDTMAREELGIDPHELGGSAMQAASASFLLFAVGAIIPVVPFLFLTGHQAVIASLIASAVGLFSIGSGITVLTGRNAFFSGGRQVLVGLAAAGLTYWIGRLIGHSLS